MSFREAKAMSSQAHHCEIKPSLRPFFHLLRVGLSKFKCSLSSGYFSAIGTRYFIEVKSVRAISFINPYMTGMTHLHFLLDYPQLLTIEDYPIYTVF